MGTTRQITVSKPFAFEEATMSKKLTILDAISIPSPCPAGWDSMTGSRQKRFCRECNKTVYNLSAMSRDEAGDKLGAVASCRARSNNTRQV